MRAPPRRPPAPTLLGSRQAPLDGATPGSEDQKLANPPPGSRALAAPVVPVGRTVRRRLERFLQRLAPLLLLPLGLLRLLATVLLQQLLELGTC